MPIDRWVDPALLIVDMQNDLVREGAPMEVADARAYRRRYDDVGKELGCTDMPPLPTHSEGDPAARAGTVGSCGPAADARA